MKASTYISFCLFLLSGVVSAQEEKGGTTFNRAAQYHLGNKDQILIQVNIWGYVQKPGQYLVPRDTDLISLISFAGGPRPGAKISSIRIVRDEHLIDYFYNDGENGSRQKNGVDPQDATADSDPLIINVNVEKYIESGKKKLIPTLKPGDTVIISASLVQNVKDTLGFISAFAIIAQMAFWITVIVN